VRIDEPACPFCASTFPESLHDASAPLTPAARLSRAALYAVGVGALSLSAAQGCGGKVAGGSDGGSGQTTNTAPPYGGFPVEDASTQDAAVVQPDADAGIDASLSNCCVPYGLPPPPPDASSDDQ
jgi:hypothetical protein